MRGSILAFVSSSAVLIGSAGLAHQPNVPADTELSGKTKKSSSFRFIDITTNYADPEVSTNVKMIGNYTRLILVRDDRDRGSPMQRRDPIDRLIKQKQTGKVVIARLSITKPNLSFSTTLGDITWVSGRKGQIAKSNVQLDTFVTPLFRVDPDTVIRIEFEVVNSAGTNISLASDALAIIGQFAKPAAAGGLINTENLPQLQRAATGLDTAISKFFKEEVTEKKAIEVTPLWLRTHPVKASIRLPFDWQVLTQGDDSEFGSWSVLAAAPRGTVFAPSTLELDDETRALFGAFDPKAARINGFQLTATKSLIEHLAGSEQVNAIMSDLQSAVADKNKAHQAEASQLLYAVLVAESQRLGFNEQDCIEIAQAFARSGRVRGNTRTALDELAKIAAAAKKASSKEEVDAEKSKDVRDPDTARP